MNLSDYERKVYSQFGEDGILLELVHRLNPTQKYFAEIGAGHNGENCTRILLDQGWEGIWIDKMGDQLKEAIQHPNVQIVPEFVTPIDAWGILEAYDAPKDLGVLSIDVDGNDYWFWRALCSGTGAYRPSLVIIESQIQKPFDEPYVMPYDPTYEWDHKSYDCGASIYSLVELGKEMNYHFIGKCPEPHSPNLFFVRDDLTSLIT